MPGTLIFVFFLLDLTFLSNLFINSLSIPPNLKIWGLPIRLIIVDSRPILDGPPSNINFIFCPNSSITSCFETGLMLFEIFALGAARGYLIFFNSFLVKWCLGNLTAIELKLLVIDFEILLTVSYL